MTFKEFCLMPSGILLAIVAVFLLVPNGLAWLAFSGDKFFAGELWRLLTFPFVHTNVGHLAENIAALLVASLLAFEVGVTKMQYVVAFALATIVVATIDVIWFPLVILVGASSGIFAIYGAFATRGSEFVSKLWLIPILGTTVLVKWGLSLLQGGVDTATAVQTVMHLAGFLTGGAIIFMTHIMTAERRKVLRCAA
jgi:membrane associated rhomboid family serine protease